VPLHGDVGTASKVGGVMITMVRRAQSELNNVNISDDEITDAWVDPREAGIVDPSEETRSAMENAASIAGMIQTTKALRTVPSGRPDTTTGNPSGKGGMDNEVANWRTSDHAEAAGIPAALAHYGQSLS
jgi:chaperonin GroEL